MPRWPLVMLLGIAAVASAEVDLVEVDSISFRAFSTTSPAVRDPLVFWTPGQSERVLVSARLRAPVGPAAARVVLSVEWALLPAGAPLREASIVWSDPEQVGSFDVSLEEGASGAAFATLPIARRAREWQEAGLDVVACRVLVRAGGVTASATLDVIPAER